MSVLKDLVLGAGTGAIHRLGKQYNIDYSNYPDRVDCIKNLILISHIVTPLPAIGSLFSDAIDEYHNDGNKTLGQTIGKKSLKTAISFGVGYAGAYFFPEIINFFTGKGNCC